MNAVITVLFTRLNNAFSDIPLPSYQSIAASGMDVRAAAEEEIVIPSGAFSLIPTNLACAIPLGYELQVRARSGLAAKFGIGVLNGPGTIDADYRGEIKIILFNFGKDPFVIKRGDRIAQLVLAQTYKAGVQETGSLPATDRGEGGFGSTGV